VGATSGQAAMVASMVFCVLFSKEAWCISDNVFIQTQFHKSWDTVQIVNKNRMQ